MSCTCATTGFKKTSPPRFEQLASAAAAQVIQRVFGSHRSARWSLSCFFNLFKYKCTKLGVRFGFGFGLALVLILVPAASGAEVPLRCLLVGTYASERSARLRTPLTRELDFVGKLSTHT